MGKFTVANESTMRIGYLTLDAAGRAGEDSPFKDVRVRQAVAHAIDREALVSALLKGKSQVISTACFPSQIHGTETMMERLARIPYIAMHNFLKQSSLLALAN